MFDKYCHFILHKKNSYNLFIFFSKYKKNSLMTRNLQNVSKPYITKTTIKIILFRVLYMYVRVCFLRINEIFFNNSIGKVYFLIYCFIITIKL